MIERQRDGGDVLADISAVSVGRFAPHLGLHDVGNQIAMQQRRALRDTGRAACVLQHRDIVSGDSHRREAHLGAAGDGVAQAHVRVPHGLIRNRIASNKQRRALHFTNRRHHHMPHCSTRLHGLQRGGKRVEYDNCLGAAIVQLMLELTRCVQRIHVHHDIARAQNRCHRDWILQQVRQHHGDPRALRETLRLKPRGKMARLFVQFCIGHLAPHADKGTCRRMLAEAALEQIRNGAKLRRIDLRRDAWRIRLQPDLFHLLNPSLCRFARPSGWRAPACAALAGRSCRRMRAVEEAYRAPALSHHFRDLPATALRYRAAVRTRSQY